MTHQLRNNFRSAFVETGLLVVGGIAGGGLSAWLLGDSWIVNGLCAIAGAGLVSAGGRLGAGKWGING